MTPAATERGLEESALSHRVTIIRPTTGWSALRVHELWSFREILYFLIWRDLKVRYRQTLIGAAWVLLQPLALLAVIVVVFGFFVDIPSEGVPYPVFVYTALIPWTLFAQSMTSSSQSLIANSALISKIYFPRLLLPIGTAGSFLVDFVIGMALLAAMMAIYGTQPDAAALLLPLFTVLALVTALGVGTLMSAINVRHRDVQAIMPLLLQLWLFASPVAYPITLIPEQFRTLYGLNPMATVISGFRWGLLGTPPPPVGMAAASVTMCTLLAVIGISIFRRTERTFADVI